MIYPKPDGSIETGGSGCCCPPGARKPGQHTNSGTQWFRVNGGKWVPDYHRHAETRVYAAAANTVAEFLEVRPPYPTQPE